MQLPRLNEIFQNDNNSVIDIKYTGHLSTSKRYNFCYGLFESTGRSLAVICIVYTEPLSLMESSLDKVPDGASDGPSEARLKEHAVEHAADEISRRYWA